MDRARILAYVTGMVDQERLAGTDFFTAEVLTLRGLVTYYVLFFIHLESRRVDIAGITARQRRVGVSLLRERPLVARSASVRQGGSTAAFWGRADMLAVASTRRK
jgi:hypothetical protein